jgi:phosphoglycerate dehydrogenase-like enzyme
MTNPIRVLLPDGESDRFAMKVGAMAEGKPFELVIPKSANGDDMLKMAADVDAILSYKAPLTRAIIQAAGKARMIQKFGLDCKNIDLAAVREKGLPLFTRSLIRNATVADHAMALMLACARRLLECHRVVAEAQYLEHGYVPKPTAQENVHHGNWVKVQGVADLLESTVGIVALGDIGSEIARRVRPFGPRICYYQRNRHDEKIEASLGVEYLPLEQLIEQSDYLILVVPLTPGTENLLSRERIARMKPTACVINVGRGGLIDEEALVDALRNGKLAGAGLDVFRWEPLPDTSPIRTLQNVVLSPHMAGGSSDRYWQVDVAGVLENIRRYLNGEKAMGLVE